MYEPMNNQANGGGVGSYSASDPPPPYEERADKGHSSPSAPAHETTSGSAGPIGGERGAQFGGKDYGHPPTGQPYGMTPPIQAGGYVPVGPTGTTTTILVTQPILGPLPINMACPKCRANIISETTPIAGTLAWLICVLMAVFGLWCGCCLIPFCIDDCQDIEHRCPTCKNFLGTYHRM